MKNTGISFTLVVVLCLRFSLPVIAWSEHPLLAYPVLSTISELRDKDPIAAKSLTAFLLEQEKELERMLNEYEDWARLNLAYHAPLPDDLRFRATGNAEDILQRFFYAIRLNPNVKMRLYLHLLPNEVVGDKTTIEPQKLTTLNDVSSMLTTNYVEIIEGELVPPFRVLYTANDEPDYGFDLGLFEDNKTEYGAKYGFGIQPFGDPNLEYGSQAPFHMGFYHEPKIVFFFGPFLKKTMPEFRISLFKALSEFAFASENPYWGYRFMGWGMHYLGDLSMPYHAAPLPGVSAFRMIWMNIKAMLGFPKSKDNAVQLVSNRHSVLEQFQWQQLRNAYLSGDENHPMIVALKSPIDHVDYSSDFPRMIVAKESVARAKKVNKSMNKWIPKKLVSDPKFETPGSAELLRIVDLTREEKGEDAVQGMTLMLSDIFRSYSMHIKSYYKSILKTGSGS
jgi:hypothetical protein